VIRARHWSLRPGRTRQNGNVLATAPAEEGKTVVEEGGERHASGESFVVESERAACHPVRHQ